MRLFIAIGLAQAVKEEIIDLQNRLYDAGIRGNYSPEENLHLTLAFIGEVPNEEPVLDALNTVQFLPFALELEGIGSFGDTWWIGVKDSAALEAVVRRLRRALSEAEIPFDRKKFRTHITVLRKATPLPGSKNDFSKGSLKPVGMTVEAISLFRSDRGRHGMIYTEIGRREYTQEQ